METPDVIITVFYIVMNIWLGYLVHKMKKEP